MLATLVIGLREGLEAALIVGIIAAFLRKNGKSLVPMWLGVAFAVVLSLAVGVALRVVEQALPQAAQEGMESVIGAVAVVFVTGMILWMNTHARGMKGDLESGAAAALGRGGAYALAGMAFLAVLKEGFETSVFLLATFSAAQSAALAALGATVGVLAAAGIGWGIYAGGVRLNLARFFRATGAFLILVAAGLVLTALRTAHEAGWIVAGQQSTVDLSWLVRPGTVQSALITGVLGIPADPRLLEVVGWFAYLVPVALYVYWPARLRPRGAAAARAAFTAAVGLAVAGIVLALVYPVPALHLPARMTLVAATGPSPTSGSAPVSGNTVGSARLAVALGEEAAGTTPTGTGRGGSDPHTGVVLEPPGDSAVTVRLLGGTETHGEHAGVAASAWQVTQNAGLATTAATPATLTLDRLRDLGGGRLPVGLNPQQHPGPFAAHWSSMRSDTVWLSGGVLLDAAGHTTTLVTISGSGLGSPRTLSVTPATAEAGATPGDATTRALPPAEWNAAPAEVARRAAAVRALVAARSERMLWAVILPSLLGLAALALALTGERGRRRLTRPTIAPTESPSPGPGTPSEQRSTTYAAH